MQTATGAAEQQPRLVGYDKFQRNNPKSDKFGVKKFHHIEFWCGDATNTARRWAISLGMQLIAKSDQTTSNGTYASYVYKSHDMVLVFTAPYCATLDQSISKPPFKQYNPNEAHEFFKQHGVAARAIAVEVDDAAEAFRIAKENGGIPMLEPLEMVDEKTGQKATISEIKFYLNGDVALRFVSQPKGYTLPFLPNYEPVNAPPLNYGIKRIDHAVGNVHKLIPQIAYVQKFTGWHEFAEFTADDVGTVDSGLNSLVLANNSEMVLTPFNEPTFGTPRKSQIQTFLEQNNGEGLQHLALKTDDIFATMREMKKAGLYGGFEFMPAPNDLYYKELPARIGNVLSEAEYKEAQELGLLADKDDQGVLLQIFTKPCSDRPTFFIEIIQRVGCMVKDEETEEIVQKGGCGGFGKGNFSYLFKSIEDYERTLIASEQRN